MNTDILTPVIRLEFIYMLYKNIEQTQRKIRSGVRAALVQWCP